jgi:hypothetical protein
MTDQPIACTLHTSQTSDRRALIADLWADALIDNEPTATGVRARLRDSPGVASRLSELIEAESRCCAFLSFDLTPDGDQLVLDINGPAAARPVIEGFFAGAAAGRVPLHVGGESAGDPEPRLAQGP